jgi:hypothetical protein
MDMAPIKDSVARGGMQWQGRYVTCRWRGKAGRGKAGWAKAGCAAAIAAIARIAMICHLSARGQIAAMSISEWFWNQELVYWVQGIGSLAAAGVAVGIALRQERVEQQRAEAARALRRQVLAAAIAPVLRDMNTTARIRNGLLQTISRARVDEPPPRLEELTIPLPEIFMTTLERIDVFGANIAAQVYVLMHRVNDYNRNVQALGEWDVPVRTWTINLRPKLDAVTGTLDVLLPRMEAEIEGLELASAR